MVRKKSGAPKKAYDEDIIKEIIYRYRQEVQPTGRIPYDRMWKYARHLVISQINYEDSNYILNNLDKKYGSEDLWRKNDRKTGKANLGKRYIDEANKIKNYFIKDSSSRLIIPDVEDTVYKIDKKEDLIEALKPLEKLCIKLIEKERKLSKENSRLQQDLNKFKNLAEAQEDAIFALARYGVGNKGIVQNILNTGSSKSKLVSQALDKIAIDPMEFLYDKKENKKDNTENEQPDNDKVINIGERKKDFSDNYGL